MGEREGNRPRIGLVITSLRPGGAERVLVDLLRHYGRIDAWEFVVISLESGGELRSVIESGGWPVVELGVLRRLDIFAVWQLAACLKRERINLVHAHLPRAGVLARLAAMLVGIPCVYTEHNVWPCYHTLTRLLNRVTLPLCASVTAVSQNVIKSMGVPVRQAQVVLVRNGLNVEEARDRVARPPGKVRYELGVPGDAVLAVNVAHLRPEKGHSVLLAAAAQVCKANSAVHFVLVGLDFGRRAVLEAEISRLGLSENVRYLGFRPDVADIMNASDLFVLSSLQEGMPISLLEAMALGKPAVVTDAGGNAEVVEHGRSGYVVSPEDPDQLAEAILSLSARADRRVDFGLEASRRVESEFSIGTTAARYEAIYRSLLAPSAGGSEERSMRTEETMPESGEERIVSDGSEDRIVYILPHYGKRSTEHYARVVPFLIELGRRIDLAVVVERSEGVPSIPTASTVTTLPIGRGPLGRMVALSFELVRLRRKGYRKVFARISISAALVAGTLGRFIGMRSYYWNSGQGKNTAPAWGPGIGKFLQRLRYEARLVPFYLATRFVHHFVTGPEGMAAYYAREYKVNPKKIIILYNDIDVSGFRSSVESARNDGGRRSIGVAEDGLVILFVGRVSPLKGGEYLLPIAERVLAKRPDALFLVVGDIYLPTFREQWAVHRCRDRIRLLGSMPNAEIARAFAAADLFILPSNSEGFPRVLLECMAAGLPFVAFDVGGIREIAHSDHGPCIVPRGDLEAFSDRVVELLEDPQRRSRLGEQARRWVETFATPRVVPLFMERIVKP